MMSGNNGNDRNCNEKSSNEGVNGETESDATRGNEQVLKPTKENENASDSSVLSDVASSPYFVHDNHESTEKKKGLPDWLNHFNTKDLKTLFKCSIAVWIATLFLLIDPVLQVYGQATFFGCIVLFILPCNGIVFIHVMGGLTMIAGMACGWTWGVISMKAALATRPASETNARLAQLAAESSRQQMNTEQTTGQSQYTQILIFEGFMLDARVSVTYFCMLGLFVYLVARIRVAAPKLALFQVFAIVVSDIFLTIGPLLPSFSGTIPSVLIKPAATAIGIGIVCNILFFPESTSHLVLDTMKGTVIPIKGFLHACKLGFRDPQARFDSAQLQKTKAGTIAAYKGIEASLGFLSLDLSRGRWSADDIQGLNKLLRHLVTMFTGLLQLQITRAETRAKQENLDALREAKNGGILESKMPQIGQNHIAQVMSLRDRFQNPESDVLLDQTMRAMFTSSGTLLESCGDAVDAIVEAIETVNDRRWFNAPKVDECNTLQTQHERVLDRLRIDQKQFADLTSQHILDPHNHLFDENGHLVIHREKGAPIHGLMLGLVFEERILSVASAINSMLAKVIELERDRTQTKVWFPQGLVKLFTWGLGKSDTPGMVASSQNIDDEELTRQPTKQKSKKSKRDKKKDKDNDENDTSAQNELDRLHHYGGTKRNASGKVLLAVIHWLGSTEGLYALRVLIVTIALGLPAVLTSSAGFFYREKGLWAVIMAQTGLVAYTADFVYGFILRVIGTVAGGIFGMVCWYIGAGSGPGNSYGMAAIMALAIVVLMWGRLFAPPALLQGILLTASTTYLVVAYSWVDTHIPSYGNPGVGYSVFWRRTLLVIIGFTASAIVIFIPRPPSASRHYRRILSNTLRTNKDLYALFVSSHTRTYTDLQETTERSILTNWNTLNEIAGPINLLKFEFSSSNFDAATLTRVTNLCMSMTQQLSQLLTYSRSLPPDLLHRFRHISGAFDQDIIGDLMAVLTLIEQSLKTGDPLPAILPVPLVARCVRLDRAFTEAEAGHGHVATLSRDTIRGEGFRGYCVVLSAFVQLLGCADELVWWVKGAVGETSRVDFRDGGGRYV